jgi:excisionase family DNA binding protein
VSTSPVSRRRGRPPGARTRLPLPPAALGVEPLAVRVDQAAAMVGCGISKLKQLIAAGTIESVKVGSMRLVKVSSLRRLVGE